MHRYLIRILYHVIVADESCNELAVQEIVRLVYCA